MKSLENTIIFNLIEKNILLVIAGEVKKLILVILKT